MHNSYEWNILDARWNNFKRWVEKFSENKSPDALMLVSKLKEMTEYVDNTQDKIDEIIMKALTDKS